MTSLTTEYNCWIGINDIDNEGTFMWADGTESTYTRWGSGEPSDSGGDEDCGETFPNEYWNDDSCTRLSLCYFCSTTGKVLSILYSVQSRGRNGPEFSARARPSPTYLGRGPV